MRWPAKQKLLYFQTHNNNNKNENLFIVLHTFYSSQTIVTEYILTYKTRKKIPTRPKNERLQSWSNRFHCSFLNTWKNYLSKFIILWNTHSSTKSNIMHNDKWNSFWKLQVNGRKKWRILQNIHSSHGPITIDSELSFTADG